MLVLMHCGTALLALGTQPHQTAKHPAALQLFYMAREMAFATLLLPESVAEACASWARHVTLCVVSEAGVDAVGESKQLSEPPGAAVRCEVQPWRPLPAAVQPYTVGCRLLQQPLLLRAAQQQHSSSSSSNRSSWQAAVHAAPGGAQVVLDVLAPAAIHADAAVKLHVSDSLLTAPQCSTLTEVQPLAVRNK
jgi:hypothetical protein